MDIKKDYLSLFPEAPSELGLNEYYMRFDEASEEQYIFDRLETFLSKKRLSIAVGVIIFILFGLVDWVLLPYTKGMVWFLRFAIIVPLFLLAFSVSYLPKVKIHMAKVVSGLVMVMGLAHIVSMNFLPPDIISRFHMSFVILVVYSFIMMKTDFLYTSIATFSISLFYTIFIMMNDFIPHSDKLLGLIVVTFTALFGAFFVYYSEYLVRRNYVLENMKTSSSPSNVPKPKDNKTLKKIRDALDKSEANLKELKAEKEKHEKLVVKKDEDLKNANIEVKKAQEDLKKLQAEKNDLKATIDKIKKSSQKTDGEVEWTTDEISEKLAALELENKQKDKQIGDLKAENFILMQDLKEANLDPETESRIQELERLLLEKTEELEAVRSSGTPNADFEIDSETGSKIEELEALLSEKTAEIEALKLEKEEGMNLEESKTQEEFDAQIAELKLESENKMEALRAEIKLSAQRIEELESQNQQLHQDADKIRIENLALMDQRNVRIEEKSLDDIKLMGRIGTFVSTSLVKNFDESIKFLRKHSKDFRDPASKHYLNLTGQKTYENMYMSAGVSYKFDIFKHFLEPTGKVSDGIGLYKSLQNSIGKMAKFFEGTRHMVDVSCGDDVKVRLNNDSFRLIIQNLVMTSLLSASRLGLNAKIKINVKEENSKVILEYQDNGKPYPSYYREILKLDGIDSSILSVNGIEMYFSDAIINRECGGNLALSRDGENNKVIMTFIK